MRREGERGPVALARKMPLPIVFAAGFVMICASVWMIWTLFTKDIADKFNAFTESVKEAVHDFQLLLSSIKEWLLDVIRCIFETPYHGMAATLTMIRAPGMCCCCRRHAQHAEPKATRLTTPFHNDGPSGGTTPEPHPFRDPDTPIQDLATANAVPTAVTTPSASTDSNFSAVVSVEFKIFGFEGCLKATLGSTPLIVGALVILYALYCGILIGAWVGSAFPMLPVVALIVSIIAIVAFSIGLFVVVSWFYP